MRSDDWITCPTCGGSGLEADHGQGFTCDGACCPTCANDHGLVPSPELIERVATILADHDTMDWQDDPDTYLPLAKAVLLASRREEQ